MTEQQQQTRIPCPTCRTINQASDTRCINCGSLLHQEAAPPAPAQSPIIDEPVSEGSGSRGLVFALAGLLVVGGLALLFAMSRPKPAPSIDPKVAMRVHQSMLANGCSAVPEMQDQTPVEVKMSKQFNLCLVPSIMVAQDGTHRYRVSTTITNNVGRGSDLYLTAFLYDQLGHPIGSGVVVNMPMEFVRAGTTTTTSGTVKTQGDNPPRYIQLVEGKDTAEKVGGDMGRISAPSAN